ncbi:MarR family transcriptional regulator [Pantoea alhagi]|uniref:MarR family transcriptional regulator n=1 Tax=Pantoea alhagi TaxID=1891675 RepID=A0A1W6B6J9_9GAMM|nr:MarR family transcriptional regulator [Pantoea alhagi]ARJ42702.1 MarR family transcriptional regulator [Pantoea alhagi]
MQDHIDFVTKQWEEKMPELDISSMKIFGRMLRLLKHLGKARANALESFGFHEGEFDVLATLRRAGEPYRLSPTQLYKSLLVTSGTMTNRLSRLEQDGLIERIADPADGRSLLVGLTVRGAEQIEQALYVHTATQQALLAPLSPEQQKALETLLRELLVACPGEQSDAGR